ncbi:MAG: winged helix-turn-helix domain-containing protein [Dissulfurispiraceae bacterium]
MKQNHDPCICKTGGKSYSIAGRIWVESMEGTFLGFGRVELLKRIKQYGSISEAAKSMNMSYRHAWDLVDSMNRQAKISLVETATGGQGGGGAGVTEAGEAAIKFFYDFQQRFKAFLEREIKGFPF